MAGEARQHHFIPAFYLAGFTRSGRRDDHLYVVGLRTKATWRARPDAVAHERDFYRVEAQDVGANAVENMLSELEGVMADAVRRVVEIRRFPDDDARDVLINFVALLAARVPKTREILTRPWEELGRSLLHLHVRSEEAYRATVDRVLAARWEARGGGGRRLPWRADAGRWL